MKLILTCKSKKGFEATEKEVDKATDIIEKLMYFVDENFKGFKWVGLRCMEEGTQIIFEK